MTVDLSFFQIVVEVVLGEQRGEGVRMGTRWVQLLKTIDQASFFAHQKKKLKQKLGKNSRKIEENSRKMEKNSREIEKTPRKRKIFTTIHKNLKIFAEKLKDFVRKPMKF